MNRSYFLIFKFLLLLAVVPFSQVRGQSREKTSYLSLGLAEPSFSFELSRKPTDSDSIDSTVSYMPNLPLTTSAEISLHGLTLGLGMDLPGTKDPNADGGSASKVKTTYSNYSASYYFSRIGFSASYVKLQGMNISSMSGVSRDTLSTDSSAHRSDIKLLDQSANLWLEPLSFNLSLSDLFDPAAKSRGSGFGLIMVGSYDLLTVSSEQSLISSSNQSPYGADAAFQGGAFKSMSAQFGPAFVIDVHGLYLAGLIAYGSGNQSAVYHTQGNDDQSTSRTSDKMDLFAATGFKGESLFTSLEFTQESPSYNLNSITISTVRSELSWLIGFRF